MTNLFKKIATSIVGMAMAIGVGIAVGGRQAAKEAKAVSEQTLTISPATLRDDFDDWTSYDSGADHSKTINGVGIHSHYAKSSDINLPSNGDAAGTYWQVQKSNGTIYNSTPLGLRIKSITLNQAAAQPWTLHVGKSQLVANDDTSKPATITGGTQQYSVTGATSMTWNNTAQAGKNDLSDDDYTHFCLKIGSSASYISSIVIVYDVPTLVSGVALSGTGLDGTPSAATLSLGSSDTDEHTITATINNADNKALTVASSNTSVAQITSGLTDGKITPALVDGDYKATFCITGQGATSGTAVITVSATDGSGKSATLTITAFNSVATVYNISVSATNGSFLPAEPTIRDGDTATITFSPNSGYKLPSSSSAFTVTNASISSYNSATGALVLSDPTDDVTVSVSMVALANYTISVSTTNCTYTGPSSILEGGEANITFTPNTNCGLPKSVTVSGATFSWNQETGVLSLSAPTGNVSITVNASQFTNTTGLVSGGRYYILDGAAAISINAAKTTSEPGGVTLATNDSTTNSLNAFDVRLVGNNTFTFSVTSGGKTYYLVDNTTDASSSNNQVRIVESSDFVANLKSNAWELVPLTGADAGKFNVKQNTKDSTYRYLSWVSGSSKWRGYTTTGYGDPKLKFVAEGSYADNVATALLSNSLCNNGETAPSTETWSTIASITYVTNEKNILKNTIATERNPLDGSASSGDNRADAMARYDYIIGKYGKSTYSDFLGRDPAAPAFANIGLENSALNNNAAAVTIVIISLVSLTAIGGFFFLRKKKEQ